MPVLSKGLISFETAPRFDLWDPIYLEYHLFYGKMADAVDLDEKAVFHMEITIIGAFLQYLKIVNLDFRRKKYRFNDDRSDYISIAFACFMIIINICFVVRSGMEYHDNYDDYIDDPVDDAGVDDAKNRHRKMHGSLELVSNASVSALTILFHFLFEEGKFNKRFLMRVARSHLIAVVQLPVQIVTLAVRGGDDWSTALLIFQIVVECMVLYSYHRVWTKVRDDEHIQSHKEIVLR